MLTIEQVRELRGKWEDIPDSNLSDRNMEKVFDTIEAALAVVKESKRLMGYLRGSDDESDQRKVLSKALTPFTAKTGDRVLCSICGSKAHSDRDCKDAI